MVEHEAVKQFGEDDYASYTAVGGTWPKDIFDKARQIASEREEHPVKLSSLERARRLSESSGVPITDSEAHLFAFFCDYPLEEPLSDPFLLAEVIRVMEDIEIGESDSEQINSTNSEILQAGVSPGRPPLFRDNRRI